MKALTLLLVFTLSACSTANTYKLAESFKIEFGDIIVAGDFYKLKPNQNIVHLENGKLKSKFGVRIENLSRVPYLLAFTIEKYDDSTGRYLPFSNQGNWEIKPPINQDYEAFISEDDKQFTPGRYKFSVWVALVLIKTFDFVVVADKDQQTAAMLPGLPPPPDAYFVAAAEPDVRYHYAKQ